MSTKKCRKCEEVKNISDFPKYKDHKDGYNSLCKSCINLRNKEYRDNNKESFSIMRKKYYSKDPDKWREYKRINSSKPEHKKRKAEYDKIYRQQNKERIAQHKKDWQDKHKNDPIFKITKNLRRRLHHTIKGYSKADTTFNLLGCDVHFFKSYIESLFLDGMTWENYGVGGWHLDHIKPCSSFDMSIEEEQRKCFHYTNIQPLWEIDNLKKGKRYHPESKS